MSKKLLALITVVLALGSIVAGTLIYRNSESDTSGNKPTRNKPEYSLNLVSGKKYLSAKPVMMDYTIQDQTGKVLKDFDIVHEKKMHLIVVRKDRTNFQHVHPSFDENNGIFKIEPFTFPTDGEYRVFADFTPSSAQKDEMGMKLPSTPYQDVQVGDPGKYTAQEPAEDKLESSANGYDTSFFFAPSDDSPGGLPEKDFFAGQESSIAIAIDKNGVPYKNLQTYLGALGHMVVLGPDLEFIHAHAQTEDVSNQSGLVVFAVSFPKPGQYRIFLQTQADNRVNTTDYTLTVKPASSDNQNNQSMPGMDHTNH